MCPISPGPNAWVTLAPSPAEKGGEGRAVGGESGQSAPIQDEFVMAQALTHTFPVSLTRRTAKPVFSVQPHPNETE